MFWAEAITIELDYRQASLRRDAENARLAGAARRHRTRRRAAAGHEPRAGRG